MSMEKKRIEYLDLVKLFTIYLVILGHVIAMMINGYSVGGRLYAFIYSFHMPLFMLLSGYFVGGSALKKNAWEFFLAKSKQLLLPAVTCTVIVCIYLFLFRGTTAFRDEVIGNSWFLKTLFVYYALFYIMKRTRINDILLFAGSCILLFVIPGSSSLQVNLLFPYFWGGYFLRKYHVLERLSGSWKYALLFLLMFSTAYYLQRGLGIPNYIEINYTSLQSQGHLILFRYFVGFTGSMTTISAISLLYENMKDNSCITYVTYYGRWSLGIYVLQTILVINVFPDTLAWYIESEFLLDAIAAPLLSLAFLVLCIGIIHMTSKNKMLNLLLFGGQYHKQ